MTANLRTARRIAWTAFTLGAAASVAANVAYAKPEIGPRLASAFAPVALLATVEIMSRVPWPAGAWWKIGRFAGTGAVALVAAITSYSHMYGLLLSYGENAFIAAIQPACVDGLMVVASLALLALGNHNQPNTTAIEHTTTPATADTSDPEPVTVPAATPAPASKPADPSAGLVMSANLLAAQHRNTTGQPITAAVLAERLGVDATTARRLLTGDTSGGETSTPARVNGHNPVGAVSR